MQLLVLGRQRPAVAAMRADGVTDQALQARGPNSRVRMRAKPTIRSQRCIRGDMISCPTIELEARRVPSLTCAPIAGNRGPVPWRLRRSIHNTSQSRHWLAQPGASAWRKRRVPARDAASEIRQGPALRRALVRRGCDGTSSVLKKHPARENGGSRFARGSDLLLQIAGARGAPLRPTSRLLFPHPASGRSRGDALPG